ncbi:MAG TPA: hypothetical protein VFA18_08920 [Gemmataceae bacterium]|nr:hypothetical protein [Gemmataceae bacterium]
MLTRFYWLTGAVIIGLYALATLSGWELSTPARPLVRPDARRSPGGSVWYGGTSHGGGFFGGK